MSRICGEGREPPGGWRSRRERAAVASAAAAVFAAVLAVSGTAGAKGPPWDKLLCIAASGPPEVNAEHCTRALDAGAFGEGRELAGGYFKRGTALLDAGRYGKAVEDFDRALTLRPEYGEVFHNRAVAKWRMDDLEGALGDFDTSIELGQVELWRAYKVRGDLKRAMRDLDGAIEDYRRSLAVRPDWEYAARALRRALAEKGGG